VNIYAHQCFSFVAVRNIAEILWRWLWRSES